MNIRPGSRRPPRGFSWPLAPLVRKLEWELEAARLQLARQQSALAAAESACQHLDDGHRDQLAALQRIAQAAPQAGVHPGALDYLAQLSTRRAAAEASREAARLQAQAAREACIQARQRLDQVLGLRDQSVDRHIREHARRSAKEADALWLTRYGIPQAHAAPEGTP